MRERRQVLHIITGLGAACTKQDIAAWGVMVQTSGSYQRRLQQRHVANAAASAIFCDLIAVDIQDLVNLQKERVQAINPPAASRHGHSACWLRRAPP